MAKLLIGNLKPPIATTSREGISKPDGTTIGINAEGTLSSLLKASGLNITDTEGLVGEANEEVTTQALINAIADKVANQLVSNNTLTTQLANYVTKSMIKTDFEDSTETVPASSLVNQLNSDFGIVPSGNFDLNNPPAYNIFLARATSYNLPAIGGNSVICFQQFIDNENYNALLCFGFGSDKIAIKRKNNSSEWTAWKYITFSET